MNCLSIQAVRFTFLEESNEVTGHGVLISDNGVFCFNLADYETNARVMHMSVKYSLYMPTHT